VPTAAVEVDLVQLAPMALYNMLAFDRMHERFADRLIHSVEAELPT
jgi:hypothetical protein